MPNKKNINPILLNFSRKLLYQRYTLNISQQELSKKVDCHINTIKSYEHGRQAPNLLTAIRIAKALNISLDELLQTHELTKT